MSKPKREKLGKNVPVFLALIAETSRTKKFLVDKRIENAEKSKKLCRAKRTHIYSTMSEANAAFSDCTMRSLENVLYR